MNGLEEVLALLGGGVENEVHITALDGSPRTVCLNIPATRGIKIMGVLSTVIKQVSGNLARRADETEDQFNGRVAGEIITGLIGGDEIIRAAALILDVEPETAGNDFTLTELAKLLVPFCLKNLAEILGVASKYLTTTLSEASGSPSERSSKPAGNRKK